MNNFISISEQAPKKRIKSRTKYVLGFVETSSAILQGLETSGLLNCYNFKPRYRCIMPFLEH
jgi:hypothetical protein